MVETDHDMRNSADFISLDRVARALIRLPGVAMVQSITRPMGRALNVPKSPTCSPRKAAVTANSSRSTGSKTPIPISRPRIQAHSVAVLRKEIVFFQKMSDELHQTVLTVEDLQKITEEMNEEVSNLDDFFRPIKSYFYWERHCFDIPICWAFRSVFDTLDHIDKLAEDINPPKSPSRR